MKRGFLLPKYQNLNRNPAPSVPFSTRVPSVVKIPTLKVPGEAGLDAPPYVKGNATRPMVGTKIPIPSAHPPGYQVATLMLFYGMKEKLLALPSFPAASPMSHTEPRYQICPVGGGGGGLGMFATVDIKVGDLIACEAPLFVCPLALEVSPEITSDPHAMFVGHMLPADLAEFMKLSNCKNYESKVRGIIDTNALNIGTLPGYDGRYTAVCRDISRVNHRCSPNALQRWDLPSFTCAIRAIRPIRAGEQIFITYLDLFQSRRDRQEQLLRMYSFKCACPSCSLPLAESRKSDGRREILHKEKVMDPADERDLRAWAADPSLPDDYIIKRSIAVTDMMAQEGVYDGAWDYHYQRLCKAYCALSNKSEAARWARNAAGLTRAYMGNDGGWAKVVSSPASTDWWGVRVSAEVGPFVVAGDGTVYIQKDAPGAV